MRQVWSFLRLTDPWPIPSSEAVYHEHTALIDALMPVNGGRLDPDGTWYRAPKFTDTPWPQSLPGLAKAHDQIYAPMAWAKLYSLPALQTGALRQAAAVSLVERATQSPDSPWDMITLHTESIPSENKAAMSDLFVRLKCEADKAMIPINIVVRGITADDGGPGWALCHDYGVLAEVADYVTMTCSIHRSQPRAMAPHWWVNECIDYALSKGIAAERLVLGVGLFSRYWVDSDDPKGAAIPYGQAQAIIRDWGVSPEWIEEDENGLLRELQATDGAGLVSFREARTMYDVLSLAARRGLHGVAPFIAGMGDATQWAVIDNWRRMGGW